MTYRIDDLKTLARMSDEHRTSYLEGARNEAVMIGTRTQYERAKWLLTWTPSDWQRELEKVRG